MLLRNTQIYLLIVGTELPVPPGHTFKGWHEPSQMHIHGRVIRDASYEEWHAQQNDPCSGLKTPKEMMDFVAADPSRWHFYAVSVD